MAIEILINATKEETRVALLENEAIMELHLERKKDLGIVGNIYKGKVVNVLPGMQATFVDIGIGKSAFLYVADVSTSMEEYAPLMEEEGLEEESPAADEKGIEERRQGYTSIEDLLQEGQELLIQVTKEPLGTKGARVTTYITLPGRYLVFMPTIEHVGISRRIEDAAERKRLRDIVMKAKGPGRGYIVRTASEGRSEEELTSDMEFLVRLWENIQKKKERVPVPSLIHADLDLTLRTVRDLFTDKVDKLVIDNKEEYERVRDFVSSYMPNLLSRVEYYDGEEPLFDAHGIEIEISRALGRRVWLKSGGYIVIDQTEALTSIDVNTGKYVGKKDPEETILRTNLEAVKEIAYQIRLRNLGGIIIIDFIDMAKEKNKKRVFSALQEAMAHDRVKTNIYEISELGLIEMSRKRVRESLQRTLCEPCSYCEGRGHIKSPTSVCYEILREIRRIATSSRDEKIMVTVNPNVATLFYDEEREVVDDLEREYRKKIIIKSDSELHLEEYEIVTL